MSLPSLDITTALAKSSDPGLEEQVDLPVRVLQFGTGAFLRGFADYFVDQANRAGQWQGRVVMVGSTGSGRTQRLNEQDGLYTLCVRGMEDGQAVDQAQIIASVQSAIASSDAWADVLKLARDPALKLIISNTTEVGITLDANDRIDFNPPHSFPGKLAAVLYERAQAFDFDTSKGLVILPCELVEDNGTHLYAIVRELAQQWNLGERFLDWLATANHFCNTLVDRIVPGIPADEDAEAIYQKLGYIDDMLTVAEPYRLWAIEGGSELRKRLPLAGVDRGIVIAEDITSYRERKVRILNGGHTSTVPAALLCGKKTVREAVEDPLVGHFMKRVILDEIVPSLSVDPEMATAFAHEVLDRFANPFIEHDLLGITFQQTAKLGVRVLPSILGFVAKTNEPPPLLAFGVAAFLASTRPAALPAPRPTDDSADSWSMRWRDVDLKDEAVVRQFALDALATHWDGQLAPLTRFNGSVANALVAIVQDGCAPALKAHMNTYVR